MNHKKSLAIVGIGRWGKNLLREFNKIVRVEFCYHKGSYETKKWLAANYPHVKTAGSYKELLANPGIDAVVIATPIKTHYKLARQALMADKHVFVEKPMTAKMKQGQELVRLATKKKRVLFVGHIFLYHPVLTKIKSLLRKERLQHASFVWNKFGTFNEELVFNLVSHDIATALDLFGSSSTSLASARLVLDKPITIKTLENSGLVTDSDIIHIRLNFPNQRYCTICINRVSNLKNKTVTLSTNKNIYLWEDDKLFKLNKKGDVFKFIYKGAKTPLALECAEFIKCLKQNKKPLTSGEFGLEVVRLLSKI